MRALTITLYLLIAVLMATATHLADNPKMFPNMIGHKLEDFSARELFTNQKLTSAELKKQPSVLNLWASWCVACQAEHGVLAGLAKQGVPVYGLDTGDTAELAKQYLQQAGNPFRAVYFDPQREIAIAMGATGTPETYLIGTDGIIYYHYRGNITEQIVKTELMPIYEKLTKK